MDGTNHDKWSNQVEFGLSMLGYCVGLGNVYRFPYLCLRNGGAAFLIPYFSFLFLIGISLFIMELYLGQYSGSSPYSIWNICPLFQGNAITINCIAVLINILQGTIVAWCFVYMYHSLSWKLPWGTCGNEWNTEACYDSNEAIYPSGNLSHGSNHTIITYFQNDTDTPSTSRRISAPQEFFEHNVLGLSRGIHETGGFQWTTICGYFLLWLIVFIAVSKGVKTMGKMVYFTALSPYLMLAALIIRGCTLPGSWDGISFYIVPDMNKLMQFNVWYEAALQIFFTLGPGWGGVLIMASHCEYNSKFIKKGFFLAIGCCLSSFYAGFVTFSILGFLAYQSNQGIMDIATAGPGLAFITYPEALAQMPFAQIWSFVFFCMLANVAIEGIFVETEVVVETLFDIAPKVRKYKLHVAAAVCIGGFVSGLPLSLGMGMYIFQLIDWYVFTQTTMVICFLECIMISHCYGFENIIRDITSMTGSAPSKILKIMWGYSSPILLLFMAIYGLVAMQRPTYGVYKYPTWAILMVWSLAGAVILPIPFVAIIKISRQQGSFIERLKASTQPNDAWGPQKFIYVGCDLKELDTLNESA